MKLSNGLYEISINRSTPISLGKILQNCLSNFSLSSGKAEKLVRNDCNDFLKTKRGFHYLKMKYPHLSVSQAINEYIKNALWIDSIV